MEIRSNAKRAANRINSFNIEERTSLRLQKQQGNNVVQHCILSHHHTIGDYQYLFRCGRSPVDYMYFLFFIAFSGPFLDIGLPYLFPTDPVLRLLHPCQNCSAFSLTGCLAVSNTNTRITQYELRYWSTQISEKFLTALTEN